MKVNCLTRLALIATLAVIQVFAFMQSKHRHSRRLLLNMKSKLIVGLNKYSHDASCAIINADNGELLFSQAKERITGRKHDGGAVGDLMRYTLKAIDADIDDIAMVVSNNHHYRVLPFEKRIPFYASLNYVPSDYSDPYNLLSHAQHLELSHHLAHAYSAVCTSPYKDGLILVMDGMGESYKAMMEDHLEATGANYMHDLKLIRQQKNDKFVSQPTSLYSGSGYREAETAYYYDKNGIVPVFKRWSRERSPSELYNSGFENHESLGAVYSRISSHVLGDWNACGKIMGLAPWANKLRCDAKSWLFSKHPLSQLELGNNLYHHDTFMSGNPYDGSFVIDWDKIDRLPHPNQWSEQRFEALSNLAISVQENLESCAMQLISSLRQAVDSDNLILTGGVALNSVMNAKIANSYRQDGVGFSNVHIPSAPGDEGIAIGCAYYGYQQYIKEQESSVTSQSEIFNTFVGNPDLEANLQSSYATGLFDNINSKPVFSPYQGKSYTNEELQDSLLEYSPWITFKYHDHDEDLINAAVSSIEAGEVVAWYQGRSELGQRALGARSILADPRIEANRQRINEHIKQREWYRPLAPSVLAEHASAWFQPVTSSSNVDNLLIPAGAIDHDRVGIIDSPYMSITAMVRPEKRSLVPAICHVDGSARLQTVAANTKSVAGERYHRLVTAFYTRTNVPMILNTSFNRKGEPIVESPFQAISSFLACNRNRNIDDKLATLYLGNWHVKKRAYPIADSSTPAQIMESFASLIVAANPIYMSEVTSSMNMNSKEPVRIRIQNGYDEVDGGSGGGGEETWITLPSTLHLEILQLLQDPIDDIDEDMTSSEGSGYRSPEAQAEYGGELSALDMMEALNMTSADDDEAETISASVFNAALRDLYDQQLIYFENDLDEEFDVASYFRNMNVVDLRS